MKKNPFRYIATFVVLGTGVWWAMASATTQAARGDEYPAGEILVDAQWLMDAYRRTQPDRGGCPGGQILRRQAYPRGRAAALRRFSPRRHRSRCIGDLFVGTAEAQKILGRVGISRPDELVLYDSVARDGGATASYVYWVLDLLGHEKVRVLERGIDAWVDAGGEVADRTTRSRPIHVPGSLRRNRPPENGRRRFCLQPVGRSLSIRFWTYVPEKNTWGKKPTRLLDGGPLKLGHIPTAVDIDYKDNWADPKTKKFKSYKQLQELYRGLDSSRAVVTYCHSARRSSLTYFVLKLMGFSHVIVYEPSWYEWGSYSKFFPVELSENKLVSGELPQASRTVKASVRKEAAAPPQGKDAASKGGYVSCGG